RMDSIGCGRRGSCAWARGRPGASGARAVPRAPWKGDARSREGDATWPRRRPARAASVGIALPLGGRGMPFPSGGLGKAQGFPDGDFRERLIQKAKRTSPTRERFRMSPKTCCWMVWLRRFVPLTEVVTFPPAHLTPKLALIMV